jgi:hypothetical protein
MTAWRKRFGQASQGVTVFSAEWPDLVCKMLEDPVAGLLQLDLGKITIRMWSDLVLRAWRKELPAWIAAPALAFLGFRNRLAAPHHVQIEEADLREFRSWESTAPPSTIPVFAVLDDSSTLDGKPDGRPCFAATLPNLMSSGFDWQAWAAIGLGARRLLAEVPKHQGFSSVSDLSPLPWISPPVRPASFEIFLVCTEQQLARIRAADVPPALPCIFAENLGDALTLMSRPATPPMASAAS